MARREATASRMQAGGSIGSGRLVAAMKKGATKSRVALAGKAIAALIAIGLVTAGIVFVLNRPQELLLQGEVDATRVIVSPKITGRVAELNVRRGDYVQPGQPLVRLDSPELRAQLAGAEADAAAARASALRSSTGSRPEDIRAAEQAWQLSVANLELARIEHDSNEALAQRGFISANALHKTRTSLEVAQRRVSADRANYDKILHGDRNEDRMVASAQVQRAHAAIAQINGSFADTLLVSPRAGEVTGTIVELGELATPARPLLTIVDLSDAWFVFNVREDLMPAFQMGAQVQVSVPALQRQSVTAKVYYIAALGDFATRRATRAAGEFDLKTFEIRLAAIDPIEGLRPGMSALVTLNRS